MTTKNCLVCNKEFHKPKSCSVREWTNKRRFCSHLCYGNSMIGVEVPETRREKISSTMKEKEISPVKKWQKGCEAPFIGKDETHPMWKGGISKDPYYSSFNRHIRRTRITEAGGSYTLQEWSELKEQFNFTCPCCLKKEPEIKLTVDHIIPVIHGGSSNLENLQPLCRSCNCKKRTKTIKYDPVTT